MDLDVLFLYPLHFLLNIWVFWSRLLFFSLSLINWRVFFCDCFYVFFDFLQESAGNEAV